MERWFAVSIRWACMIHRRCHGSSYHSDQIETYSRTNTYKPFFFLKSETHNWKPPQHVHFSPLSKKKRVSKCFKPARRQSGWTLIFWLDSCACRSSWSNHFDQAGVAGTVDPVDVSRCLGSNFVWFLGSKCSAFADKNGNKTSETETWMIWVTGSQIQNMGVS